MSEQTSYPERRTRYVGPLTNTDRWDAFNARTDDVFVCTPPKCGTTWMQAICANLIFGTSAYEGKMTDISPWIDSNIESMDVCMKVLEAQAHRRFIKTHTPLDGIPYFNTSQYLIVYRSPKDVYFSVRNHLLNWLEPPNIPPLAADPDEGFSAWINTPFEQGVGEQRSLEAFTQHFSSFWNFRHLENFHFFHYGDMKRDLSAAVVRIADILEIPLTDDRVTEICDAVSFSAMKKNASAFVPAAGKPMFKSDEAFFSSGRNEQWHGVLGANTLANYEHRLTQLLEPDAIAWLER